jgi:hypothetical protein
MTTADIQSSEQKIIQVLQEFNPFTGNTIVKMHQIWDEDFSDVLSINSHASDEILNQIIHTNKNNIAQGITILAPKGTGKTHLLSRIRHHLKNEKLGYFIYMCEYGNLSSVKSQFLQGIASSLRKIGSSGVMQWQDLANSLISNAIGKPLQAKATVAQFPNLLSQKPQVIKYFSDKILQANPNLDDPYIARAIVWTLSPAHAPFAINWLAGRELSEAQAKLMDLPEQQTEDHEIEAFSRIRQILDLLGAYGVPVICFDELDGTEAVDEENITVAGFTRAMVVASLAKDVYNSLRKGVILTSMYEKTWKEEFQGAYTFTATTDRIAQKKVELIPLREEDTILLVTHWLNKFYTSNNLQPPYALYPFNEEKLREQGKERPTVREILNWCADNLPSGPPIDPMKALAKIYQETYSSLEDFRDDNDLISNSLKFCFNHLTNRTIEGVSIHEIIGEVRPKSHRGNIQFKILGKENGSIVKIGVSVAQHSHGKSVGSVLKYIVQYETFDLTRGCLVRNKSIASHWSVAQEHLGNLVNNLGGEWISFEDEELKPIIAIYLMYKQMDLENINKDDFYKFIDENHPLEKNILIKDILSDPSGKSPTNVIDEDGELERLLSEPSSELSDSFDDLIELGLIAA